MERHVYKPPKGSPKLNLLLALLGGAFMTFAVFFMIPLMKKLEAAFRPSQKPPQELLVVEEPPEEFEREEEPPPEEEEEEPPEMSESQEDLDLAIDLPTLSSGVGGIVIDLDMKFDIRDEAEGMFDSDDLDQPPRPTSKIHPRYPPGLKSKRVSGRVLVGAQVDENGVVQDVTIKESSGHVELDRAAADAIKRWRYQPAIKGGRKVRTSIVQPFSFRVE